MAKTYSSRGFGIYAEEIKTHDGETLRVSESSLAFEGAHVRIYVKGHKHQMISDGCGSKVEAPICAHMNVAQAKELVAALQMFVDEAEADALIEPVEPTEEEEDEP